MKLYAEQVSQLLATEKNLRSQLTADGEKFQQFQVYFIPCCLLPCGQLSILILRINIKLVPSLRIINIFILMVLARTILNLVCQCRFLF